MQLSIVEKTVDDVMVVDLLGRVVHGDESVKLRNRVKELVDEGHSRIILNLEQVDYVDSVGLSTLVASYTAARKRGGDLKLLRLTKRIRDLLQITRLITVFESFETLEEAQQSFDRKPAA